MFFQSSLLFLLPLATLATTHDIVWGLPCGNEVTKWDSVLPIVCGSLSVPLDYTAANLNQTLDLPLYKIPVANGTKSKHSVLLNFGGPGNDGLQNFAQNSSALRLLLGEEHDLVLVEPRGITANFNFSCAQSVTEGTLYTSWTALNGNASDVAQGELWATSHLYADACKASKKATNGNLIGTAFTARDFMQVADALHEDGLIYYQGYSYGTVLGMTIASLFPDKIGRMLLDGNVNVYDYYQNSYVHYYSQTDKVFSLFCSTCIASPHLCALAHNQSSIDLENELVAFFDKLKYHPLPVFFPDGRGGLVDYSFILSFVDMYLYAPSSWPTLSVFLSELLSGVTTNVPEAYLIPDSNDWLSGIRCGDSRPRTNDQKSLHSIIETTTAESPIFGSGSVPFYYTCAQWPFMAKGNFSWPKNQTSIKTKKPVLLIGNSYDPVTPLANAEFNSAALDGSVVLQNGGVGHTALYSQGSLCTAKAIRAYWVNGSLPLPETLCKSDSPVFSTTNGWPAVLKKLAQENGQSYS